MQSQVNNQLQEFSKGAEFLNDVRQDMANLIEAYAKQGRSLSFEEAYNIACNANPQIQAVMAERKKAEQLKTVSQTSAAKRNASSSLAAKGVPGTNSGQPQDLRGALEAAWENFS